MESRRKTGFSLLELLVVVVILAIIAAIVFPPIFSTQKDAEVAAAMASLKAIQVKIDQHYRMHGEWPATIERSWFVGNQLPKSPWKEPYRGEAVNIYGQPDWFHPRNKTVESHDHPYWYNPRSGAVRIRVPTQSTTSETVALYNRVNSSQIRNLGQTSR